MSRKRRNAKPAGAALSEQSSRRSNPAVAPQVERRLSILMFVFFFASWIITGDSMSSNKSGIFNLPEFPRRAELEFLGDWLIP